MSKSTAIAVINPEEFWEMGIQSDSALAQMLLEEMPGGPIYDAALFADEETLEDYDGIAPDVPRISLNAKMGQFINSKDKEAKNPPSSITGVMLCRDSNNIFFGFKSNQKERIALCKEHGLQTLLDQVGGYICRGLNDGKAELNPQLNADQVAEAKRLRFGGATGQGCATCPMGQWIKTSDGNKRMCADSENIVWLDSQLGEPVVLGMIAGGTISRLRKWIAATFNFRGQKMNLFAFAVQFAFLGEKDENDNHVASMKILGQLTSDQAKAMLQVRKGYKHMLERAALANAYEGNADETRADSDNVTEPGPGDDQAPVPEDNVIGNML